MTVTIRNPLIHPQTNRVRAVAAQPVSVRPRAGGQPPVRPVSRPQSGAIVTSKRAVMPWNALGALRQTRQQPPYDRALTPIDVMLDVAAQPPESQRAQARTDRRTGMAVLGIGAVVLIVACVAAAVLLDQLFHIANSLLA
jgi:hypothetical protein